MSTGAGREFIADIDLEGADPLAVKRGEQVVGGEATARWAMGSARPSEVVWTRLVYPVLLSNRLVTDLREAECSGWSAYPVGLFGKEGESLPEYWGLVVSGRCGPIDAERSVRIMKDYPAGSFPVLKGLAFDEASWDGSDFCMPSDRKGWVFVTERAKNVVATRARNVLFTPLDEVEQVMEV